MKRLLNSTNIITFVLCISIFISLSESVFAQRNGEGPDDRIGNRHQCDHFLGGRFSGGFWTQLTDEQKDELLAMIEEMREGDATRGEIHDEVAAQLAEWGIEMPERRGGFGRDLSEEQKEILETLIQDLKNKEATREEIHAAVVAQLSEWGIELPERPGRRGGFHGPGHCRADFWDELNDNQKATLREMIKELWDQGATREAIRAAIAKQLEAWGIEPPDGKGDGDGNGRNNRKKLKTSNSPNPFNPVTKISYTLENSEYVTLKVYNLQGQLIRTLVEGHQPAGTYSVKWDGRNASGDMAVSGVYFYHIEAGDQSLTQRMTLMK